VFSGATNWADVAPEEMLSDLFVPRAEILRRKILLRDLLDVGVDVAGIDRAWLPGFVAILEELMT
jgi:hypothetical protein